MYQFLEFDEPIPSCQIFSLNYNKDSGKWKFIYAINTPFELKSKNDNVSRRNINKQLIIYEYISDLILKEKNDVHDESVNITISNLEEYIDILKYQRDVDNDYRGKWKKENPDIIAEGPNIINLNNRNYNHEELSIRDVHYIASIYNQKDDETAFAAI